MKLFKNLFKKEVKDLFPKQEHVIEHAFTVGDVDYYRFADIFSLPYERGLYAVSVYNELDMRCTREYLILHTQAISELLLKNPIDVYKINELNEQIKQRLNMITDVDTMYRLASVVYFDKNENPATYEQEYAEKKIQHWKQHKGTADFFLQKPLMELIPYLQNVDTDLDTFTVLNERLNELHLAKIQLMKSSD